MNRSEDTMTGGVRADTTFDKVARWCTLVLAVLGVVAYSIGLVTELDRIARDFWEDGIVLGFCYSWLTGLGVLRSFRPHLPRGLHLASALANVLAGYVLVMFWVGLFTGKIDKGAEFIPILMTVAYIVILRGIRIREHFRPQPWLIGLIFLCTILNVVIPEVLHQRPRGLSDLNQDANLAGAVHIVTILAWIAFMIVGFWRGGKVDRGP